MSDMISMKETSQVVEPRCRKDLTGQIFGKWRVDEYVGTTHRGSIWRCTCLGCGTQRDIYVQRLTGGKTKSCGKEGCRTYTTRHCDLFITDPEHPKVIYDRMRRARRVWLDLMEMSDPKYRRCDKQGRLYNIKLQDRLKDWQDFAEWTQHDNTCVRSIPGVGTVQACYNTSSSALYHIPTHMMPDGSTPFFTYNLVWAFEQSLQDLPVKPDIILSGKERKYYLDPETDTPMTRQQLSVRYMIPVPTISAKLAEGMGLVELIETHRQR